MYSTLPSKRFQQTLVGHLKILYNATPKNWNGSLVCHTWSSDYYRRRSMAVQHFL